MVRLDTSFSAGASLSGVEGRGGAGGGFGVWVGVEEVEVIGGWLAVVWGSGGGGGGQGSGGGGGGWRLC